MDSCICYSTCNDTEQHSTYCAAENAFEYQDRFDSDDEYLIQRICDMDEDAGINDIWYISQSPAINPTVRICYISYDQFNVSFC